MQIVHYPHPTLRHKSSPVRRVDRQLADLVREMFELMYAANGVGLAANQVALPLRLFVVNLAAKPDEGQELVFINPVLTRPKGSEESEEGCLSLPGLYGNVVRPKQVQVQAFDLRGSELNLALTGLLARVVQHECDHLDGVLFTDRMSPTGQLNVKPALDEFETVFQSQREVGEIESDEQILADHKRWQERYCEG